MKQSIFRKGAAIMSGALVLLTAIALPAAAAEDFRREEGMVFVSSIVDRENDRTVTDTRENSRPATETRENDRTVYTNGMIQLTEAQAKPYREATAREFKAATGLSIPSGYAFEAYFNNDPDGKTVNLRWLDYNLREGDAYGSVSSYSAVFSDADITTGAGKLTEIDVSGIKNDALYAPYVAAAKDEVKSAYGINLNDDYTVWPRLSRNVQKDNTKVILDIAHKDNLKQYDSTRSSSRETHYISTSIDLAFDQCNLTKGSGKLCTLLLLKSSTDQTRYPVDQLLSKTETDAVMRTINTYAAANEIKVGKVLEQTPWQVMDGKALLVTMKSTDGIHDTVFFFASANGTIHGFSYGS